MTDKIKLVNNCHPRRFIPRGGLSTGEESEASRCVAYMERKIEEETISNPLKRCGFSSADEVRLALAKHYYKNVRNQHKEVK